jgi:hypothetical protein
MESARRPIRDGINLNRRLGAHGHPPGFTQGGSAEPRDANHSGHKQVDVFSQSDVSNPAAFPAAGLDIGDSLRRSTC